MKEVLSISVITFGLDGTLFIADSKTATIFAFKLDTHEENTASKAYNIFSIDSKISNLVGSTPDQIVVKGFSINPINKEAYIAFHRGCGDSMTPVLVRVNNSGIATVVDLDSLASTKIVLPNPIDSNVKLWNNVMARSLSITDIKVMGGELFVSGLSNAEFSSVLYRIPYPFDNKVATTSVEMYHAVHGINETRAPIRAMTILNLNNKPHLLAAYLCTPIVTIPISEIKDGSHVKGKTIGELGFGNVPTDIISFHSQDTNNNKKEQVLIINKNRGPMLFDLAALEEANEREGLSSNVGFSVVAPKHMDVPMAGVLFASDQDNQYIATLRRDLDSGRLDLLSFRKGAYFRLSDFVSEFMMPGFHGHDEHGSQFQNMLKRDEGFA